MSVFTTAARVFATAVIVSYGCANALAEAVAVDHAEVQLASTEADSLLAPMSQPTTLALSRTDAVEERGANARSVSGLPSFFAMPPEFSAKWAGLRSRIELDEKVLSRCRLDRRDCPVAAQKFLKLVDSVREHDGRALIGQINRAVNLQIRPVSDQIQYGVSDFWSAPLETFATGAGDCEDYAIAKYVALQHAGVAREDLRLVIMREISHDVIHAVVVVRNEGQWLLLDNRTSVMVTVQEARHYRTLFVMGDEPEPRIVLGQLNMEKSATEPSPH
jgi:predicted transglutaminase-like cysteine proteinase